MGLFFPLESVCSDPGDPAPKNQEASPPRPLVLCCKAYDTLRGTLRGRPGEREVGNSTRAPGKDALPRGLLGRTLARCFRLFSL